jgi:hypothetical protein
MIVNIELKWVWKEAVRALFLKYYPGICVEGLRENTKTLGQDIRSRCYYLRYRITEFIGRVSSSVVIFLPSRVFALFHIFISLLKILLPFRHSRKYELCCW